MSDPAIETIKRIAAASPFNDGGGSLAMSDQQSINVLYIWTTDDTGAMERHGFTKTGEGHINGEYVWRRYARECEHEEVGGILEQLADIDTAHPSFVLAKGAAV